ncbi:MAG: hypothetical protein AAGG09_16665 [Pseudomonadota bacterium]
MGSSTYRITRTRACPYTGRPCLPGHAFLARLQDAVSRAGDAVGEEFEIAGSATLTCGARACPAVWRATQGVSSVLADAAPEADIARLTRAGAADPAGAFVVAERHAEPVQ